MALLHLIEIIPLASSCEILLALINSLTASVHPFMQSASSFCTFSYTSLHHLDHPIICHALYLAIPSSKTYQCVFVMVFENQISFLHLHSLLCLFSEFQLYCVSYLYLLFLFFYPYWPRKTEVFYPCIRVRTSTVVHRASFLHTLCLNSSYSPKHLLLILFFSLLLYCIINFTFPTAIFTNYHSPNT